MKPYSKDLRVRMLAAVDSGVRELALAAVTPEEMRQAGSLTLAMSPRINLYDHRCQRRARRRPPLSLRAARGASRHASVRPEAFVHPAILAPCDEDSQIDYVLLL
jgi:hypothetical protein